MTLIAVGTTPPPVHGAAIMTSHVVRALADEGLLAAHLETRDGRSLDNIGRLDVTNVRLGCRHWAGFAMLLVRHRGAPVYLTLAPSGWGFLRDAGFILMAKLARRRVIVHLEGGAGIPSLYRKAGPALRTLIRRVFTGVDRAWVLTPSLLGGHEELVARSRLRVIENCVDPVPVNGARASGDRFRVLFLSNLSAEKGCFDLLAAVDGLGDAARGWRIHLAGPPSSEGILAALEARCRTVEGATGCSIDLVGPVYSDAKQRELEWADALVLPTRYEYEGQPLVLLEALSAGVPVVSTCHAGIADTIADGRDGLLVQPGDIAALGDALRALGADPALRERFRRYGQAEYARRFTPARFRERLLELVSEVDSGAGR